MNQSLPENGYANDEISLIDIASVLVRRKWQFFSIFTIGLLATIGFLVFHKPVVSYQQMLKGAFYYTNDSKMQNQFIAGPMFLSTANMVLPSIRASLYAQNIPIKLSVDHANYLATDSNNSGNKLKLMIPNHFLIKVTGKHLTKGKAASYTKQITQLILQAQMPLVNAWKNNQQKALDELAKRSTLNTQQTDLVKNQIDMLGAEQKSVSGVLTTVPRTEIDKKHAAMPVMNDQNANLINVALNESGALMNKNSTLVSLYLQKQGQSIALKTQQLQLNQNIALINRELKTFTPTSAVSGMLLSPSQPSKRLMYLALGFVASLMLALLLIFVFEFSSRVKKTMATETAQ